VELLGQDFNERAIKCYEKLGFIKEEIKRKAVFINSYYYDTIIMRILQQEWKEKSNEKTT
jgi:RimJ/RimL family protein N-acetyltransferase